MASQETRQTGWALRIYKNSDNKVLAIDDITVITDTRRITLERFHHSSRWTSKRTLIHLGIGDRIISTVQMLGDYDLITEDSGDYLTATWSAASENENDVVMLFDTLPKTGDTL